MRLIVHFTDGEQRTFDSYNGETYRYAIVGGALVVLKTPRNEPIANSEPVAAFGPTRWGSVDGLAFGNLSIAGLDV